MKFDWSINNTSPSLMVEMISSKLIVYVSIVNIWEFSVGWKYSLAMASISSMTAKLANLATTNFHLSQT